MMSATGVSFGARAMSTQGLDAVLVFRPRGQPPGFDGVESAHEPAYTPTTAAIDVEALHRLLEGRWKLVILFHLFGVMCSASRTSRS